MYNVYTIYTLYSIYNVLQQYYKQYHNQENVTRIRSSSKRGLETDVLPTDVFVHDLAGVVYMVTNIVISVIIADIYHI